MRLAALVREDYMSRNRPLPKPRIVPLWILRAAAKVLARLGPERHRRAMRGLPVLLEYLSENIRFSNRQTLATGDTNHEYVV